MVKIQFSSKVLFLTKQTFNSLPTSMKQKLLFIIIILTFLNYSGMAQDFRNLDFEYGVYKNQPRKWSIEGEGEHYSATLDSTNHQNGNRSLYVKLRNAQVFIFFSLPRQFIAGKTIQIEAYIRSLKTDSLQTMLVFHNPDGGRPNASEPNKIGNEWKMFSHQVSFPENYSSDRLLVAVMAVGSGSFGLDNVKIVIDGKEYGKGIPDFKEPTKAEIATLNKMCIPIQAVDSNSGIKELAPLSKLVANARIVALGENSHGSSTIYKVKLQMVKYLVMNEGFTIFALESPTVEADRINEYVTTGKGTTEDVIKYLAYPSWQTKEMMDIIQWIKSYNLTTDRKVQFRGFDMQDGTAALKKIEDFAKNDTALLAGVIKLKTLNEEAAKGQKQWDQVYDMASQLKKLIELRGSSMQAINTSSFETVKHYTNIFLQSVSMKFRSEKNKTRDAYMAENIEWLVNQLNIGGKIIVSADNTHVTKASGKMGQKLTEKFGDKYRVFGFTYKSGSYSAYGPEKYYEVHPPYVGTYEYFFSKCKTKNYILDIRDAKDMSILNVPSGFRSIGSRPQETTQFTEINLKDHFDAIVYIDHSDHTTLLTGQ
jgi:erythromycin esterase